MLKLLTKRNAWMIFLLVLSPLLSQQNRTPQRPDAATPDTPRIVGFGSPGSRGLEIVTAGSASVRQSHPVQLEFYTAPDQIENRTSGYQTLELSGNHALAAASIPGPGGSHFTFNDEWSIRGSVVELSRTVKVSGTSSSGFMSSVSFSHEEQHARSQVDYFAPGMVYGSTSHLSYEAIGGEAAYEAQGHGQVRIREDRLPAPMFGVRFQDGSALTVLDPAPNGQTTQADSGDTQVRTLIDQRFRFGAIGVDLDDGHNTAGFWFPGTEGEETYRGNTYPGGQIHTWRRRYHPIREGLVQQYRVQFRFSHDASFPLYVKNSWRWAFAALHPKVTWQDIQVLRRSIVDVLARVVQQKSDWAGIPNALPANPDPSRKPDRKAIMGFTGKNLEAAEFLLADAQIDPDPERAQTHRKLALAIFSSFIRLQVNPPVGEGFDLETGKPALAIPRDQCVFLRSFGDDMKAALRAYRRERTSGRDHPEWLAWARAFGDWLLTQQTSSGGFPRSWKPGTGEVLDASLQSSYNPVPFLCLLTRETGDPRYLHAAERAADLVWSQGQNVGKFVGGTIDNPDVLDKEAGTLSTEAYLALYEATHDAKWLNRACAGADYSETWIYLWNVPMPVDADNSLLHWKRGVPTYGTQLIATGHSLVDDYMAFDVDEFAKLGRWTGDEHYLTVSKLLLHDTKNMVAVPGRVFDLNGPGWQQEHFSFAPIRGFGLHRLWLPWVATSQLNGIFGLMEFDPNLYKEFTTPQVRESQ